MSPLYVTMSPMRKKTTGDHLKTPLTPKKAHPAGGSRPVGVRTAAVHAGTPANPLTGASAPDLVMSTTFVIEPGISFSADDMSEETPFVYTRWGNPTNAQLEQKVAVLEGAEACVAFGSGVAAITALFLHTLKAGDHLVMSDVTYAAASEFVNQKLPEPGNRGHASRRLRSRKRAGRSPPKHPSGVSGDAGQSRCSV